MNKFYNIQSISAFITIFCVFVSCNKETPSIVFFPDMYYSVAYDPYQEAVQPYISEYNDVPLFKNREGQTAIPLVNGTVSRNVEGILPIGLENTLIDYEVSKSIHSSPLSNFQMDVQKNLERGKTLYEQNCLVCHGIKGDGNGSIVQTGSYNGVPKFADRQISVGSVHYVITYGKNAMGSYASHMNSADRWRVAEYVMSSFKSQTQQNQLK